MQVCNVHTVISYACMQYFIYVLSVCAHVDIVDIVCMHMYCMYEIDRSLMFIVILYIAHVLFYRIL